MYGTFWDSDKQEIVGTLFKGVRWEDDYIITLNGDKYVRQIVRQHGHGFFTLEVKRSFL